jgi:hypothetical protein
MYCLVAFVILDTEDVSACEYLIFEPSVETFVASPSTNVTAPVLNPLPNN